MRPADLCGAGFSFSIRQLDSPCPHMLASLLAQHPQSGMRSAPFCLLRTWQTNKGGPAEIVVNKKSGFHIDPYHGEAAAGIM